MNAPETATIVRAEDEDAARAQYVAELTAEARDLAAKADEGMKSGAAKVAAGLIEIGRAHVVAVVSAKADATLKGLQAPPAGRARFRADEVTDAVGAALLAAYPSADGGSAWTEELRIALAPIRCVAPVFLRRIP